VRDFSVQALRTSDILKLQNLSARLQALVPLSASLTEMAANIPISLVASLRVQNDQAAWRPDPACNCVRCDRLIRPLCSRSRRFPRCAGCDSTWDFGARLYAKHQPQRVRGLMAPGSLKWI
jgi:hypothetical protein